MPELEKAQVVSLGVLLTPPFAAMLLLTRPDLIR
jgi:hypothetical protein